MALKEDHQILPDAITIEKAAKATVLNHKGEKVVFGTLFEGQKSLVVFIRHFFCGACQLYVSELATIPPSAFEEAGTKLIVVGCGDWQPIDSYKETTSFSHEIYADPSRSLHEILSMVSSFTYRPPGEEAPKYLKGTTKSKRILTSSIKFMTNPILSLTGKGGDMKQNGGEFIFGPGMQCEFANRMRHIEDHTEVEDLMKAAGVKVKHAA